jgi:uncharacterized protein
MVSKMKIEIRELRDGSNPAVFEVPQEDLDTIVKEADPLYFARDGAAKVDLTVDRVDDLLSVRGRIDASAGYECARCLTENARPIAMQLRWTLVPRSELAGGLSSDEEIGLTTDDLEVSFYEGEEIDLGELVRESLLLELDSAPRCGVDSCVFSTYTTASAEPADAPADPRWAPLQALRGKVRGSDS